MSLCFETFWTNDNKTLNIRGFEKGSPWEQLCVEGQLSILPGSPTIWVSHNLEVPTQYRRKGFSTEYNSFMLSYAFNRFTPSASAVLASVKYDNAPQQWRLEKLGWTQISNAM